MFNKLLANILGSIIKSSGIDTNVKSRNFNIKKTIGIFILSLMFATIAFLVHRISILSQRIIDHEQNYTCVKHKKVNKKVIKK